MTIACVLSRYGSLMDMFSARSGVMHMPFQMQSMLLELSVDLLGVPADDDEVGLDAEVRAHRLGKLGVKADQVARLGILVVDGGEKCDADVEDAVAEYVVGVALLFREGEGRRRKGQDQNQQHAQDLLHGQNAPLLKWGSFSRSRQRFTVLTWYGGILAQYT